MLLSSQSKFCLHKIADFKGHFDSPETPAGISRGGGECELVFCSTKFAKVFYIATYITWKKSFLKVINVLKHPSQLVFFTKNYSLNCENVYRNRL